MLTRLMASAIFSFFFAATAFAEPLSFYEQETQARGLDGVQVAATVIKRTSETNGSSNSFNSRRLQQLKKNPPKDVSAKMGSRSGAVVARVNLATQTMTVTVNGVKRHTWRVSSGRAGHTTPRGTFRPQRIYSRYFSKKYDYASMHSAVFYSGGYAVHATPYIGALGRRASHGCIRLHPSNARTFLGLAKTYGRNVKIIIS